MCLMAGVKQVEAVNFYPDLTVVWDLRNTGFFYQRMINKWFGFTIGNNIVVVDMGDSARNTKCFLHERRHCMQNYVFGILFFPVYIFESLRIYLFRPEQHAYLDNRFERDAREYAGQPVNIPRSQWPDGEEDRVPWF